MPGAYSADLRQRALLAGEQGRPSRAKVARLFQVAESTVDRWLQTWRREGRREAKPHAGGPAPRLDAQAMEKLRAMGADAHDLSLAEYAARLSERANVTASGSTVCRALQKLRLPRKKDAAGGRAGPARYHRGSDGLAGRTGASRSTAADLPR